MGYGGFRQHAGREAKFHKSRRKGGGKFHWKAQWRPPKQSEKMQGTTVLVIPAIYKDPRDPAIEVPYYVYKEHSAQAGKNYAGSFLCSRGLDEHSSEKCNGCLADEGKPPEGVEIRSRVFAAVGIVVLANFHLVPVFDKDTGEPILYKRGDHKGEQVKEKHPCAGRGCELCSAGHDVVFGAKKYMALGKNHLEHLYGIETNVVYTCACGGELRAQSYMCQNCAHPVWDSEEDATLPPAQRKTEEEINKLSSEPRTCPSCGHRGMLFETVVCDTCDEPVRLSLMPGQGMIPAVISLARTGSGTSSALTAVRARPATDYTLPDKQPLLSIESDPETGADELVWHKDIEPFMKQFDFESLLSASDDPQELNRQAEVIKKLWPGFRSPYSGAGESTTTEYQK